MLIGLVYSWDNPRGLQVFLFATTMTIAVSVFMPRDSLSIETFD
jgi:hypothetical protein